MINVNYSESNHDGWFHMETLEYCWPLSRVKLEYNFSRGKKTHHLYMGWTEDGFIVKSKDQISETMKKYMPNSHWAKYVRKL